MCGAVFPDIMNNFGPFSKFFFCQICLSQL